MVATYRYYEDSGNLILEVYQDCPEVAYLKIERPDNPGDQALLGTIADALYAKGFDRRLKGEYLVP